MSLYTDEEVKILIEDGYFILNRKNPPFLNDVEF
jgi:hypothetical protein